MKRSLLALTLLVCSTPALAQKTTAVGVGTGIAKSSSQSGAVAISGQGGQGGNSSLTVNNPANVNSTVSGTTTSNINQRVSGTQTVKNVPSVVAPGLAAAGLETCLGSASGTVSAIGFGIGGGSTYADEGCQARLDSRTLYAYGLKAAAVARLCQRADIFRSMPDICAKYWPEGMPYPAGIVIAPQAGVAVLMSTNSMRIIDGRDGVEKDCINYNAPRQKCMRWAGEPARLASRTTGDEVRPKPIVVKRKPKEEPAIAAITSTIQQPKPRPVEAEPEPKADKN